MSVLQVQERSSRWLALKIGRDPSYVHRVLNGKRRATPDFRRRVATALSLPEDILFPEEAA